MTDACMIYATAGSREEAETLAKTLVTERLVACVNIFPEVTSVYRWEGQTESEQECVLIAKTLKTRRSEAMKRLNALHSYDTPCIVSYDMTDGLPSYVDWISNETSGD